jgi:sRNA-binding regulator protein Hfq
MGEYKGNTGGYKSNTGGYKRPKVVNQINNIAQSIFLSNAKKQNLIITISTIDGIDRHGRILRYDSFAIIIIDEFKNIDMIYKNNIVSIKTSELGVDLFEKKI